VDTKQDCTAVAQEQELEWVGKSGAVEVVLEDAQGEVAYALADEGEYAPADDDGYALGHVAHEAHDAVRLDALAYAAYVVAFVLQHVGDALAHARAMPNAAVHNPTCSSQSEYHSGVQQNLVCPFRARKYFD